MKGQDWLSERVLFGSLVILGYLGSVIAISAVSKLQGPGLAHDTVVAAIGTLGTAVGAVIQAVFRTDKADKQNAEAMKNLSQAVNTAGAPS